MDIKSLRSYLKNRYYSVFVAPLHQKSACIWQKCLYLAYIMAWYFIFYTIKLTTQEKILDFLKFIY